MTRSIVVEVSARKFGMPWDCPCCGAEADSEREFSFTRTTGKRVIRSTTRGLAFPYCTPCIAHVNRWESAPLAAGLVLLVGIVVGVIAAASAGAGGFAIVFAVSLPLALVASYRRRRAARAMQKSGCTCPGAAVGYLGWNGSVSGFAFVSTTYAIEFAKRNARNLINVGPDLRRLLQSAPEPTSTAPKAIAVPIAPAKSADLAASSGRDRVLDWIARIEGYKGPVARRNALQRALEEVTDPAAQRDLVLAASKIEVAAVLAKVETLATGAAKRRCLEKAIADVREDNIPDELQVEELRELEARLTEVAP